MWTNGRTGEHDCRYGARRERKTAATTCHTQRKEQRLGQDVITENTLRV
jgi:hypothetical protein